MVKKLKVTDTKKKRARSPQKTMPCGALQWRPGFRPRPGDLGRGRAGCTERGAAARRRRSRLPTSFGISGTPRDRARERRRATRAKTPGLPLARANGLVGPRLRSRCCSEPQVHAGLGGRPPGSGTAALAAFAVPLPLGVLLPGAPPAPRLPGSCTPGSRGRRCGSHLPEIRGPGTRRRSSAREGPGGHLRSASQQPFVRLRDGHLRAAVISVIQTARQWRGQTAGSRLPRGPLGRPRTRTRARTGTRQPPRRTLVSQ